MWYHLRKRYIGKNPTIEPYVPNAVKISATYCAEEGNIPRICVSDHIFKCITGILGILQPSPSDLSRQFDENPCLYITDSTPYVPPNCLDFRDNNEHWFITPTKFIYLGRINLSKIFKNGIIELTTEKELKPFSTSNSFHIEDLKSNVLKQLVKGELK